MKGYSRNKNMLWNFHACGLGAVAVLTLLAITTAAAPAAAVEACPGWMNRDLAKHMGGVYAFVTAQLRAGNPQARMPSAAPDAPDDGDITTWLRERHHDVLTTGQRRPPRCAANLQLVAPEGRRVKPRRPCRQ